MITDERKVACPHCRGSGQVVIPPEAATVFALFFGCWSELGHYWRHPTNPSFWTFDAERAVPLSIARFIDGGFAPGATRESQFKRTRQEVEGEAALHRILDWTVLSWWDRSVDYRGSSNSSIVVRGIYDYGSMLAILEAQFPSVKSRQRVPIRLVEDCTQPSPTEMPEGKGGAEPSLSGGTAPSSLLFRADGWPLCPLCGGDELYSLAWNDHKKPSLSEFIETLEGCYRCGSKAAASVRAALAMPPPAQPAKLEWQRTDNTKDESATVDTVRVVAGVSVFTSSIQIIVRRPTTTSEAKAHAEKWIAAGRAAGLLGSATEGRRR